jgi:hypothetical protein
MVPAESRREQRRDVGRIAAKGYLKKERTAARDRLHRP